MNPETITKIDAIRRHTEFAIRSLFKGEDIVPIIVIASSAFQIARDLAKHKNTGRLHAAMKSTSAVATEKEMWRIVNSSSSFLKHADRDPDSSFILEQEELPDALILLACYSYFELTGNFTKIMEAFMKWISLSKEELSSMYKIPSTAQVVIEYRELPRSEKLEIGSIFLRDLKPATS